MQKTKFIPILFAAFCMVAVTFFVFSFIDYRASGPSEGTTPTEEAENDVKESTSNERGNGNSDITNTVQNNVKGNKADVKNTVENNANAEDATIDNTIDNQLNNSNDNQIENNLTNNIEVNVNVNVSNNITNHAEGQKSNSNENSKESKGNSGENGKQSDASKGNESTKEKQVWGVDSASLTTQEMLECVTGQFGNPTIWGRYLGDKDGVSKGLTPDEINLLHDNNSKVLVIWNHFTNATGFESGQQEANEVIQKAQELGVPEGVALFADIEPNYPVDSEFIRGWYETMNASNYVPGIYGVFDAGSELSNAYEQAGQQTIGLLENMFVWTAYPQVGVTTEANAPDYRPEAPSNALIGGWQYGLEAQACNIDTNLFHSDLLDVVW